MHDPSLEQKLRAALRSEGDQLAFTITAAELERRLVLRRRGGLSPMASLGLAAAVGVGLLGLVGVAGGWFETRPVVAPSPSPVAVASTSPSGEPPSAAPSGPVLPSFDAFLAPLDPARIVRAQAVGPAAGPTAEEPPAASGGVGFAPVTSPGAYRVWTACIGTAPLQLIVVRGFTAEPEPVILISCDGSTTSRQVGLESGDWISLRSGTAISWRFVLEAPPRDALRAASIADIPRPADGETLLEVASQADTPDYAATGTGGGIWTGEELGGLPVRNRYRVIVICAGPSPIQYAFRQRLAEQGPSAPIADDLLLTQVECDGAAHEDRVELPQLGDTSLVVTSEGRTAWRILVVSDLPPIALAPDGNGWQMSTGFGPTYLSDGAEGGTGGIGPDDGGDVRVVISCAGETILTGSIDPGPALSQSPDPFRIDCSGGATLARTYEHAGVAVDVRYFPDGAKIWLAVTTQVRAASSPPP